MNQKRVLNGMIKDYRLLRGRIEQRKQALAAEKQKPSFENDIKRKDRDIAKFDMSRVSVCNKLRIQVLRASSLYKDRCQQILDIIKLEHKFQQLESNFYNASETLQRLKIEVAQAQSRKSELKVLAKKYLAEVNSFKRLYASRDDVLAIFENVILG